MCRLRAAHLCPTPHTCCVSTGCLPVPCWPSCLQAPLAASSTGPHSEVPVPLLLSHGALPASICFACMPLIFFALCLPAASPIFPLGWSLPSSLPSCVLHFLMAAFLQFSPACVNQLFAVLSFLFVFGKGSVLACLRPLCTKFGKVRRHERPPQRPGYFMNFVRRPNLYQFLRPACRFSLNVFPTIAFT